jgi:hypothetical protein
MQSCAANTRDGTGEMLRRRIRDLASRRVVGSRAPAFFVMPFALVLAACTTDGSGPSDDAADVDVEASVDGETSAEEGVTADATTDGETSSDAAPPDIDGAAAADGDAPSDGSADAAADAPVSLRCGDGIRDPVTEECDDGLGDGDAGADAVAVDTSTDPLADRRSCTSDCHVRDLLAVAPPTGDAGPSPHARMLGNGRHPLAGDARGFAVAFIEPDSIPPRVALTTFDSVGRGSDVVVPFSGGSTPALAAHPVIASSGDGRFYAAWNDFDGDGDELGIAIRVVDPSAPSSTAPRHANSLTAFSQFDADILAGFDSSGQVVIAWVDDSSAATGPDVRARLFDRLLLPIGGEIAVATTTSSEADIALAPFGGSWAIAWKSASAGLESTVVKAGALQWQTESYLPGPSTSRPAINAIDATHLLLVFAADDGTGEYRIRIATLDAAAPGAVTSRSIDVAAGASANDRREPNVVQLGGHTFVTWRAAGVSGDAAADELWIKEISWTGTAIDLGHSEMRLPRRADHRPGDQRRPALAALPLTSGGALVAAWDDLGKTFGLTEGNGDVVVEMIPIPLLRLGDP